MYISIECSADLENYKGRCHMSTVLNCIVMKCIHIYFTQKNFHGFLTVLQYSATDLPFKESLNFSKATVLFTPILAESKAINIAKSLVLVRVRFAISHLSYFPDRNANLLNGWSLCLTKRKHNTVLLVPTLTWHGEELRYRY